MEPEYDTACDDTIKNAFEGGDQGAETNGDRQDHITGQAQLNSSPTITHGGSHLFKSRDIVHPGSNSTNSMSSMMNQVVMKTTPLKERRGGLSRSQSLRVTTSTGKASSPSTIIKVTKLISSPSFSAERAYPEILYSPTVKTSAQNPKTDSIKMKSTATSQTNNGGSSGSDTRGREVKKKQREELLVVRDNEEIIQVRAVLIKHTTRQHPVIIHQRHISEEKELEEREEESTDGSEDLLGSSATAAKQSTTVDNSDTNVSTEMDLLDTLQPLLEHSLDVQPRSLKRSMSSSSTTSDSSMSRTQSAARLVSPERRRSLVEEASRHIKRKRHSTEVKGCKDSSVIRSPSKSVSSSDLLSPLRREKLIENAADYILQRRKSLDKYAPSSPTLGFSSLDASLNSSTGSSFKYLLQASPSHT